MLLTMRSLAKKCLINHPETLTAVGGGAKTLSALSFQIRRESYD